MGSRSAHASTTRAPHEATLTSYDAELGTVWRDEWGRLLALLVAQYRRLDVAEDGLGDAFESAARAWPRDGVPTNPAAWLLTAARRRVIDRLRTEVVAARTLPALAVEVDLQERAERTMADAGEVLVDERLRLVLLCAHPSLAPEHAAALTLRLVLGVSTEDIARLFLVSTPTMAARLTRARKRLAGAAFDVPSGPALVERVGAVAAISRLAFTAGYAPGSGADVLRADLAGEAIRLVRVLRVTLAASGATVPGDLSRELDALLALMLLQHARRDARVRYDGGRPRLVLLPDQDRSRWRADEIGEALDLLGPHVLAPGSPYLLEALVAAEHAVAAEPGRDRLGPDRRPLRRARGADRLARRPPQPRRGRRRGRRSARGSGAAGRPRPARSSAARRSRRAVPPGGPRAGGAGRLRPRP